MEGRNVRSNAVQQIIDEDEGAGYEQYNLIGVTNMLSEH